MPAANKLVDLQKLEQKKSDMREIVLRSRSGRITRTSNKEIVAVRQRHFVVQLVKTNWQGPLQPARETSIEEGKAVLLSCLLDYNVEECQWSWQPLNEPESVALVVKQFPAFGNQSHDCSVRFSSVQVEQEGVWTCGARSVGQDGFAVSTPITLRVRRPINFSEVSEFIEAKLGKPATLGCKTVEPIEECQWSWRSGKLANESSLLVKQFSNSSGDCSIHLDSIHADHEGLWTCGVRRAGDSYFMLATDTNLTISKEMEFVQLSQGIQVNAGEPVLLRCVVNLPVEWCQWSWQPLGHPEAEPIVVKGFSPAEEQHRDCSVRFASVLEEQEGLWSCAIRHKSQSSFHVAPPAMLTLLPPVKIRFLETPQDIRVALGQPVVLQCVAASAVTDCLWTWHPLGEPNKEGLLVKQFSAFGNYSRDCSVHFKSVLSTQEGFWGCAVRGGPPEVSLQAETPLAKLTTYELVPVQFLELSKNIQIPSGNPLSLRCVASSQVEECQWSWKPLNHTNSTETLVVSTFPPYGNDSQDCSMRLKTVSEQHEGIWTCAAHRSGENEMTTASPTRVTLLKPESVMVALWTAPKQKVTLACRLSSPQPAVTCHWHHPPDVVINQNNQTKRHSVQQNNSTGVCSLILDPQPEDMGQWRCVFTMVTQDRTWELAAATLVLLTTTPMSDKIMDWLVGVLGGLVLLLTLLLIGMLVCKHQSKDKSGLGSPPVPAPVQGAKKGLSRYTEPPSKINFQFGEPPMRPDGDPCHHSPEPQHIYEQVDCYISPTTSKSIYENIK